MRAPGHPQGCAIMEAAMDDLADKLGIDPLEFRLKNLAPGDFQHADLRGRGQDRGRADRLGENRKPRGQNGKGPIKRGLGMALHHLGRRRRRRTSRSPARSTPTARSSSRRATQDIGTGARTILAIIAAEVLGPEADRHHVEHRQLDLPARARPRAARPPRRR